MNAAPLTERFNVRRYGSQGPLLLFGHGFCTDSHVFKHQVDVLSQDHQVITYDLAGFGQADPALFDPARHHRLEGYAEDLVALLDERGGVSPGLSGMSGTDSRAGLDLR